MAQSIGDTIKMCGCTARIIISVTIKTLPSRSDLPQIIGKGDKGEGRTHRILWLLLFVQSSRHCLLLILCSGDRGVLQCSYCPWKNSKHQMQMTTFFSKVSLQWKKSFIFSHFLLKTAIYLRHYCRTFLQDIRPSLVVFARHYRQQSHGRRHHRLLDTGLNI